MTSLNNATLLLFYCLPCHRRGVKAKDKLDPEDMLFSTPACPRCGEKTEYINYGYGFKETQGVNSE